MAKAKTGDGVIFVVFACASAAEDAFKKWHIARDEDGSRHTIHDVLTDRERWRAVPLTFYESSLTLTLELPLNVDSLQEYMNTIKEYIGDGGAIVGCTWMGRAPNFHVVYRLGAEQESFQAKIDTFMPLKEAKAEFFTLREVLYRATMNKLFGEETEKLSETEAAWLAKFAPID